MAILDVHLRLDERGDVVLVSNTAHELGEPVPHRVAVELTEQGCVVEPNPASFALLDVVLEGGGRFGFQA